MEVTLLLSWHVIYTEVRPREEVRTGQSLQPQTLRSRVWLMLRPRANAFTIAGSLCDLQQKSCMGAALLRCSGPVGPCAGSGVVPSYLAVRTASPVLHALLPSFTSFPFSSTFSSVLACLLSILFSIISVITWSSSSPFTLASDILEENRDRATSPPF